MTNINVSYEYKRKRRQRKISAEVVGPLAYHPTIDDKGFWTVSHVASGLALCRFAMSCKQAKEIAVALSTLNGWDASETDIIGDVVLKQQVVDTLNRLGIAAKIVAK